MSEAEKKRGVGRPKELPDDAAPRTIRMTGAEREAVLALLERLRRPAKKPRPARKGKGERP